jgi:hypothetical protein
LQKSSHRGGYLSAGIFRREKHRMAQPQLFLIEAEGAAAEQAAFQRIQKTIPLSGRNLIQGI